MRPIAPGSQSKQFRRIRYWGRTYFDAEGLAGGGRRLRERGLLSEEVGGNARGGRRAGRGELVLVHEHHLRILLAVRSAPARGGGGDRGIKVDAVLLDGPRGGGGGGGVLGLLHKRRRRGGGRGRGCGGGREGALRGGSGGVGLRHESGADGHGAAEAEAGVASGAGILGASRR